MSQEWVGDNTCVMCIMTMLKNYSNLPSLGFVRAVNDDHWGLSISVLILVISSMAQVSRSAVALQHDENSQPLGFSHLLLITVCLFLIYTPKISTLSHQQRGNHHPVAVIVNCRNKLVSQ
jgi:hypothetical protein